MLSSRYLHLHEALGLGPMWLNRGAKVRPAQSAAKISDGLSPRNRPSENMPHAPAVQPSENENTATQAVAPPVITTVQPAAVMVVSICPAPEDSAAGKLFSGSAGVLLDNMLAAIGLKAADAHKTSWVKTSAVFTPEPPPEQVAAALPQMQAELAASQAQAVLFLGQVFAQPRYAETIAQLCGGIPAFTVPHPARLLRQPQLKKQAWEELQKLRSILPSAAAKTAQP